MSEVETFWVSLAEKFFGLLLTIIGALSLYFTLTSTAACGRSTNTFVISTRIEVVSSGNKEQAASDMRHRLFDSIAYMK